MSNRREIMKLIENAGSGSVDTLLKVSALTKAQIQNALYKLHDYGEITKVGVAPRKGRRYGKPYSIYAPRDTGIYHQATRIYD